MGILGKIETTTKALPLIVVLLALMNPIGFLTMLGNLGVLILAFFQVLGGAIISGIAYATMGLGLVIINGIIAGIRHLGLMFLPEKAVPNYLEYSDYFGPINSLLTGAYQNLASQADTLMQSMREYIENSWLVKKLGL